MVRCLSSQSIYIPFLSHSHSNLLLLITCAAIFILNSTSIVAPNLLSDGPPGVPMLSLILSQLYSIVFLPVG
jgi:hypothetical protein